VTATNFCPQCGGVLQLIKKGSPSLRCTKCKYQKPLEQEETKRKVKMQNGKAMEITIISKDEESMLRSLPTVKVVCPKCGHTVSEVWNVEAADENIHSTITFFRCIKCKTTRRESG
jgi:transcription factor S